MHALKGRWIDVLDFYLVPRYVQCVSINDNENSGEYMVWYVWYSGEPPGEVGGVPGPGCLGGGEPLHQLHRLFPAPAHQGPQPLHVLQQPVLIE